MNRRRTKTGPAKQHASPEGPGENSPADTGHVPAERAEPAGVPVLSAVDEIEEASIESFPASDPPGYGTGHA